MTDDEYVTVRVHGSASVGLSGTITVDPISAENGDLDSDKTLAQMDGRGEMSCAKNSMRWSTTGL